MDSEFLMILKSFSLEVLVFGFIAFALTMIIKLPIKKLTAKLSEEKRKLANSLIMFIPAIISLISAFLYYGIFTKNWLTPVIFQDALSSWILSLTIYAIFGRVVIIIKGLISGKLKVNQNLTKETVKYIHDSIKNASAEIKKNTKELNSTKEKIKSLSQLKIVLESNEQLLDLTKLSETNIEIEKLETQGNDLCKLISQSEQEINDLKSMLYAKEES